MEEQYGQEYKISLNNIPGGVHLCLNDEFYSLVEINQGFLEMFGFSGVEIESQFENQFMRMVHPEDRRQIADELGRKLASGDKAALNYRVLCRDGYYKWVTDNIQLIHSKDGVEQILNVLLDDTKAREAREELRLSLDRHRIIMNQTTDIIFEWNIAEDTMVYSTNWMKKFGYLPRYDGMGQISALRHIYSDDIPVLRAAMEEIKGRTEYQTVEVRIQTSEGRFIWCRIRGTKQYDSAGSPLKVVGVITDINEEKWMIDDLRRRAERDALTGLYNREETELQIRRYLECRPKELCALFMIDTDNFKLVNDSQGHLFGDAVLTELAAVMKKLMRQSDVVGRIGGDEFMIFLKNIPSKEVAEDRAETLLEMFQQLFREEKQLVEVTCSAGVAIYPDDGEDFYSLYHSADVALYQAKNQGKNQYVMFDKDCAIPIDQSGYSSLGAEIDSDQRTSRVPGDLVNYVFRILYDACDIDKAIQLILEIVGKRFDVSRAYIFENSEDGLYTDNTYEWCNEGITPEKENLQHFPYEEVEGYEELFKDNTIFYCRDIHSLTYSQIKLFESQGICSTLQCAIRDEKGFRGFVGFDECTGMRLWTKEEIGMLSLISQILTTFLQKKRATDRDRQMAVQLNTILDVQDAYIYAINQEGYQLLYLNHKTRQLDPNASIGMTCHKAFFKNDEPCRNCPLSGGDGEIYNPQYDVWTRVQAAPMKWGDCDAYLLSCFDITEYKKKRLLENYYLTE